ncbi:MAG: hypothetical protein COA45_06485 [Zetaproteobacteria bacterium]|nr:MAG: hypothetical protein COA45_06485 [Zetaproteobacteria bacterium]
MIQELFNKLKVMINNHGKEEHQIIHDDFEAQFGKSGQTLVERIALSPELNGEDKENPEDYYEGLNYSLPIIMYIMKRTMEEEEALEEQGYADTSASLSTLDTLNEPDPLDGQTPYQDHLNNSYTALTEEIIETHQKHDETLKIEDIRIPSQEFIENLTNDNISKIIALNPDIEHTHEHSDFTQDI